jgi:hypothetical protein
MLASERVAHQHARELKIIKIQGLPRGFLGGVHKSHVLAYYDATHILGFSHESLLVSMKQKCVEN